MRAWAGDRVVKDIEEPFLDDASGVFESFGVR